MQFRQARGTRHALDTVVFRIDGEQFAAVAALDQVPERPLAHRIVVLRGADDRDRRGPE